MTTDWGEEEREMEGRLVGGGAHIARWSAVNPPSPLLFMFTASSASCSLQDRVPETVVAT